MKHLIQYVMHPEDKAALDKLKAIPAFPEVTKYYMEKVSEQTLYGTNLAQKIKLGPRQLPEIYKLLPPLCEIFNIPEPGLYLEMDPRPNAYTFGDTNIFITITSGLVEYLDEDELRAVIAHECGHIICHHVLYTTMAYSILNLSRFLGSLGTIISGLSQPIILGLLYWQRRSEFSADRAAAVALRGHSSVVETMIRLAGGPKTITGRINMEEYLKQADDYDKLLFSEWDQVLQGIAIMYQNHPFLSVRSREIIKWSDSIDFDKIIEMSIDNVQSSTCQQCGKKYEKHAKFCKYCGEKII